VGKIKVTVTGTANKPPKIKKDGTIDLLLKVDMSQAVPKGLTSLGSSFCLIHIGSKTWKKVAENVKDDSFYIINGEAKASINNKNIPFFEIVAFDISIKSEISKKVKKDEKAIEKPDESGETKHTKQKVKVEENENQSKIQSEIQSNQPKKKKKEKTVKQEKTFCRWFEPEEVEYVSYKDIILTEKIHLQTKKMNLQGLLEDINDKRKSLTPMAVRQMEDKYSLVMGMKYYLVAKALEVENVPIVIRDMTHEEFLKQYETMK
jgi:hypothetical protein